MRALAEVDRARGKRHPTPGGRLIVRHAHHGAHELDSTVASTGVGGLPLIGAASARIGTNAGALKAELCVISL